MTSAEPWPSASGWREFFDLLSDAVVVFDSSARVVLANTAALRLLPCELGMPVEQFQAALGGVAVRWLRRATTDRRDPGPPPMLQLTDGSSATIAWRRLDTQHAAMHLSPAAGEPAAIGMPSQPAPFTYPAPGMRETIAFLWASPYPAVLQGPDFRIVDANAAFAELCGVARDRLIGSDPVESMPAADRPAMLAARARLHLGGSALHEPALVDGRLLDASGRERRYRGARRTLIDEAGQPLYLALLQDTTAEHVARERADRSLRELDDWFDLSPVGMVLSDDRGLLVRTNPAFDALVGVLPGSLADAPADLCELLGWGSPAVPLPERVPESSAAVIERHGWVTPPGQSARLLRAIARRYETAGGQRRTMAVIEDRSAEQERDLAQLHTQQLLHELTTIIESTTAGIAYLRADVVVRCNRRFEAMLGLSVGAMQGRNVNELLGTHERTGRVVLEAHEALEHGTIYETEFDVELTNGAVSQTRWYSLSVRRAGQGAGPVETIAVLSDMTRLKARQQEFETVAREGELMFSLSGVGIAFVRDGRIQRANQALAHLAGCSVAELTSLQLADLFTDSQDFERRWPQTLHSLVEYGRWTGERQLRTRDGRALWVQVSKRFVIEGDPAGGLIASYVNVDSRHRAERAVAMQAERTRSILDSVLVGIVTVGPQGIEWMNRSARRMFGGDLADFVNLPIATVATDERDHPFLRTEYLTELVEGQAETFECRVKARDGRQFWIVGNVVSTERESTGRQLTYALLDIERRREAEARMSQAQAQLQRIIEAAPLAITLRDARMLKVVQVNAVAAAINRTTPEALIGRTPEQTFDAETAAVHRLDMEAALATAEVTKREYVLDQDGEQRIWDARYLPLSSGPGQPPDQLLLVATDVTEQRAAQQARLEAAIEQRDMLVKEVHHRIKNNLQGVAGLLQQIAQRKPEVAGPISEVVGQVHAIAQVYGLQVGESGPLPLVNVVRAITTSVQRTFGQPILFEVSGVEPDRWLLPEAEAIPIALTLNELLTNAVKHCVGAPRATVHCTLASTDSQVQVLIVNPGALPEGFNLGHIAGGVSGLGLVRALLPRRSARLLLTHAAGQVLAEVTLSPPGVTR